MTVPLGTKILLGMVPACASQSLPVEVCHYDGDWQGDAKHLIETIADRFLVQISIH